MRNPFFKRVIVEAPSDVGSDTELKVDLEDVFGSDHLDEAQVDCVEKRDSDGSPKAYDDDVSIDSDGDLLIEEGATGFAAGDRWTCLIYPGRGTTKTAASS